MSGILTHSPLVLIADDDEGTRLLLSAAAEQVGLSAVTAKDGLAALNLGLKTQFAMVLLDVEMPGLTGHEVCRRLRAAPQAHTLPIIMITARNDAACVREAFEAGATDFIVKPINMMLVPRRLEYNLRNADLMRALERREAEYRTLIQSIPDTVYLVRADGHVQRAWNDSRIPGAEGDASAPGRSLELLLPPVIGARAARHAALTARDGQPRSDDYAVVGEGGEERAYELRYVRCATGEIMALRQDVTARKRSERRIHELAFTDTLTGLPNRPSFLQALGAQLQELAEQPAAVRQVAVLVLHVTGFEHVNEVFGYSVGDELMRTVAGHLARSVAALHLPPSRYSLARLEGNQFVMCLSDREAADIAQRLVAGLAADLKNAVRCGPHEFFLRAHAGIALYPDHGGDAEALIKNASMAMLDCQSSGLAAYALFAEAMSQRALLGISLDAELRRAVSQNHLQLCYQPKFAVQSGAPLGAEALLRWTHPRLGPVSPERFIAIAEQTGLILDVSAWVVRAVCRQLREWRAFGLDTCIAVNLSGKDFMHGDPAALVAREIAAAGIPAACLELEVTESVLVNDFERVSAGLSALRALGCRVALDDFGTGYSSLRYLQRLPVDRLKVDRSFVIDVHRKAADGAIFEAIITLARRLGLAVTAEGVEERGQLDWLRARGCDEAQGFLLARPLRAADLELLLTGWGPELATPGQQSADSASILT